MSCLLTVYHPNEILPFGCSLKPGEHFTFLLFFCCIFLLYILLFSRPLLFLSFVDAKLVKS